MHPCAGNTDMDSFFQTDRMGGFVADVCRPPRPCRRVDQPAQQPRADSQTVCRRRTARFTHQPSPRPAGQNNADELIGSAMGLNETARFTRQPKVPPGGRAMPTNSSATRWGLTNSPFYPSNRAPARRANNADELIGQRDGSFLGSAYRYGGTSISTGMTAAASYSTSSNAPWASTCRARRQNRRGWVRQGCPKRIAARGYGVFPHARRQPHFPCRTLYRQQPLHPRTAHGEKYRNHQPEPQILERQIQASARQVKKKRPVPLSELISQGIRNEYARKCPNGTTMTDRSCPVPKRSK